MRAFAAGVVVTLIVLAAGVYLYAWLGWAPVATSASPLPLERALAQTALHARIVNEAPLAPPFAANEGTYMAAIPVYRQRCAVCHGLPQQPPSAIAQGMYPPPPQFFVGKGVSDDPPGVTYWKVTNGIRLTGMPSFNYSLTESARWEVSLMLANSSRLPASVLKFLVTPPAPLVGTSGN